MKLAKYGVILLRLTEDKIQLVRNWRNDPKIVQFMEYKEYITPEMQLNWFHSINNKNSYYFIIEYEGKEIGLINVRDIDYMTKEGEGGIFIFDDTYLNSDVSFRSSLCLTDFCFEKLRLKTINAHILKGNTRAIKYNQIIGFKLADDQENVNNQLYKLVLSDYYKCREFILNLL